MLTIEKLRAFGADVDKGVKRCVNDESFYLMLVESVLPDTQLDALEAALNAQDLDKAFEIAHALKGVYGNIELTPIYTPVSQMTELLRNRTKTDYSALIKEAKAQKNKLNSL